MMLNTITSPRKPLWTTCAQTLWTTRLARAKKVFYLLPGQDPLRGPAPSNFNLRLATREKTGNQIMHNDDNAFPPGDFLAAKEPAPYPDEWTPEQRVSAYWAAHKLQRNPQTETEWRRIFTQTQNDASRHHHIIDINEYKKATAQKTSTKQCDGKHDDL